MDVAGIHVGSENRLMLFGALARKQLLQRPLAQAHMSLDEHPRHLLPVRLDQVRGLPAGGGRPDRLQVQGGQFLFGPELHADNVRPGIRFAHREGADVLSGRKFG